MAYVIRYTDGAYNQGNGFPCRRFEATQYDTIVDAQQKIEDLMDVEAIEDFESGKTIISFT